MYTTMYTGGGVSRIRNEALLGVELSHVNTNFGSGDQEVGRGESKKDINS